MSSIRPRERSRRATVSASTETRVRLLRAALTCIEHSGLDQTSLEDVANEAGLSRATVYRYFPGGREQLVSETVTWEVGAFFARVEAEVSAEAGLSAKLQRGLVFGHRAIDEHVLLQRILRTEPEALLEELSASVPIILEVIRTYVVGLLDAEDLRPGIDRDEAADYVARLFLSYVGSQGQWDLTDPVQVERLVRTQIVAGILEPQPRI